MSLKINRLDKENEYVVINVIEDVNIGDYALIDRIFDNSGTPSKKKHHFFHFPKMKINKGDFIRVHTSKGKYEATKNQAGTLTHNFYWGLDSYIWNNTGDTATIIKFSVIDSKTV
ncbi:MAG: hypothetical protein POELPBGB_01389 [Bacteroidia bacterium]|nr:hypothetical protein [Bacteroidia bacterium]